ncbi:hypothetical protein PQX77_004421 [Marasmius sp. AFHP31]|nr:hypothetical protein PQX77_004421 [Marasmius sp. AFHP31]
MTVDIGFPTESPFVELSVSTGDIVLGSIVFGFFFGFLIHVFWTAVLETKRAGRITGYVFMIWFEMFGNLGFAILSWLYLYKVIPPHLAVFTCIIICWIIQVQCLMLIIVNRLCILLTTDRQRFMLKSIVTFIVFLISVSSACIWIPAQLQISHAYIALNHWWDKFEKSVYLCLDLALNIMFIVMVKKRLVNHRLTKYAKVMRFNEYMIVISMGMDVLLMGTTTLKNGFVYCQFHPVVYMVKLSIEMSMSRLLIKVARSTGITVYEGDKQWSSGTKGVATAAGTISVRVQNHVITDRGSIELAPEITRTARKMDDSASIASQDQSVTKVQQV